MASAFSTSCSLLSVSDSSCSSCGISSVRQSYIYSHRSCPRDPEHFTIISISSTFQSRLKWSWTRSWFVSELSGSVYMIDRRENMKIHIEREHLEFTAGPHRSCFVTQQISVLQWYFVSIIWEYDISWENWKNFRCFWIPAVGAPHPVTAPFLQKQNLQNLMSVNKNLTWLPPNKNQICNLIEASPFPTKS